MLYSVIELGDLALSTESLIIVIETHMAPHCSLTLSYRGSGGKINNKKSKHRAGPKQKTLFTFIFLLNYVYDYFFLSSMRKLFFQERKSLEIFVLRCNFLWWDYFLLKQNIFSRRFSELAKTIFQK